MMQRCPLCAAVSVYEGVFIPGQSVTCPSCGKTVIPDIGTASQLQQIAEAESRSPAVTPVTQVPLFSDGHKDWVSRAKAYGPIVILLCLPFVLREAKSGPRQKAYARIFEGDARSNEGDYDKAIADYSEAIRLDPELGDAYNGIAWLFATCPNADFRDGVKAVENARRAYELTKGSDANVLDTLAAAHAEAHEFDKAIEWQAEAVKLAPQSEKEDYYSRLVLYKTGKPYRETPFSRE